VISSDGVSAQKKLTLTIHPPFWQTWWFHTLSVLMLAGLLYSGLRYRIAQVRKEERLQSEHTRQQAAFQKKVSELEMQALRAQMNPHFIFNCLNSINGYILENQPDEASDYLAKFARLIRLILQNSNAPTVSLENELEALDLYLKMEALRFEGKFTFEIQCDQSIEAKYLEIPPLLIQPYVENAIWHGLLHKKEEGHLSIHLLQEEGLLLCSIEDDGIGRKRSIELKSKTATKKKSMGMKITAQRLELLTQLHGKQAKVEVIDLVDAQGSACGTRVFLKIPL
jgi:LytS/YehU family sensor histidine kinase